MKNLKLISAQKNASVAADCFCEDVEKNYYFSTTDTLFYLDKKSHKVSQCGQLISEVEDSNGYVVGMDYMFETNSIFIVTSVGDMFIFNIDDAEVSAVGFVETQVNCFAWSPDQEFLILLTGANTLILMTKDFDPISEKSLCPIEFGENEPINVGWGSKTTQFHGSVGKGAAQVKQKEPKPCLPYDDRKPRISWRKDGEYFATSTVDEKRGYRLLRIWSQEAVLQFTSEIVEGLEENLSWRPNGNLIACSQQCPNKHKIIFFEKNGLQHGEFALPFQPNTFKVSTLSWNSDSSVLLVVAEEISASDNNIHVMFWTSSNYYWYLKQKFVMKSQTPYKSLIVNWSSYHPLELQCYDPISTGFYQFKWTWSILCSESNNDCENSIIASIDSGNLLISPFGKLVIPPPMCAYMYSLNSSIEAVFFAPDSPTFAAYLGNLTLAIFKKGTESSIFQDTEYCKMKLVAAGGNGFKSQVQPYSFDRLYVIKLNSTASPLFGLCHFTWTSKGKLLCVGYCAKTGKFCILSLELPAAIQSKSEEVNSRVLIELECAVIAMCTNTEGTIVAVQLQDGKVFQLDLEKEDSEILKPWTCHNGKDLILSQICSYMSIISLSDKHYILGLSEKYNLFCNDIIILSNCTSFVVHEEFLLVTTVDHVIKCFSRAHDLKDAIHTDSPLTSNVPHQNIEKGARIIIVPAKSTKVILQMPRGNLETIHPRPLIISAICSNLDKLQFSEAFNLAKVHRIDLNVLHDHNKMKFLDNIEAIIEQLTSPSDLNLLLASLKNEDVCLTMYPLIFAKNEHVNAVGSENKVNVICDAFRKILELKDIQKYYQTLMTTYAKKDPSELDKALLLLKSLKDSAEFQNAQNFIDGALNFLLYLVDVETLRLTALGTYDLATTIMVEQKSQRDPKEFLPFYNDLNLLEENYRKYKIDMYLKRYKKALQHISKCDEHFEECLTLIKEQRLYTDAIALFPASSDRYKVVWQEYGNYLMEKRYFEEAGLAFTRCGEHEKAVSAYKESTNWQMALSCASKLDNTKFKMESFCRELAKKLKSNHKYIDAAYLLEHYVKDPEECIVTLIDGYEWSMALLIISKHGRDDISESHLKPALKAHQAFCLSEVRKNLDAFKKHAERLKFLRTQKKIEAETQSQVPKFAEDDLFSDIGSVTDAASSVQSKPISGSITTRKSSKSRRKQKLKKYRLKEGSPDEHLALLVALSESVTIIDTSKESVLLTLKTLVHFAYDDLAKELHELMCLAVKTIETEIPIIWNPSENIPTPVPSMQFGPESTANSIAASLQYSGQTPSSTPNDPELAAPPWRKVDVTMQMLK